MVLRPSAFPVPLPRNRKQVFVTFESDLSQARCLSHMSRGILDAPEEQHMYTNPDGKKGHVHATKDASLQLMVPRSSRTVAFCCVVHEDRCCWKLYIRITCFGARSVVG